MGFRFLYKIDGDATHLFFWKKKRTTIVESDSGHFFFFDALLTAVTRKRVNSSGRIEGKACTWRGLFMFRSLASSD